MANITREDIEALVSELREYKGEKLLAKLRFNSPLNTDILTPEDLCKYILELLKKSGCDVPADALAQPRLTLLNILRREQPSDVQELKRLEEGLEEKKKILLQEEIARLRRELVSLNQEIPSRRAAAGPSLAKEEPKLQRFVEPPLAAPFPEGSRQDPLPVPPVPTPPRKGLRAMVEMMT